MEQRIKKLIQTQAESFGVRPRSTGARVTRCWSTTAEQTERALAVAQKHFPSEQIVPNGPMLTGSEDFAFMLERVPGSYLFIGNGTGGSWAPAWCTTRPTTSTTTTSPPAPPTGWR
jgi:hippurate hydrolase